VVRRKIILTTPDAPRTGLAKLAARFQAAVDANNLQGLAHSLGLSVESLRRLSIGWATEHGAWSFPMTDVAGRVLGIRLRRPNGSKYAVKGSKEGLFLPAGTEADSSTLLICEGPTDTAALLDLGFVSVVGRPSCTGGVKLLSELVRRRQPAEVVVVSDSDEPGRRGADNLGSVLVAYVPAVRVISPPADIKDVRAWLQVGGMRGDVEEVIDAAPVRRLTIRTATEKGG
jgi:5S rRNA maturation endonuclease (ribonuclease M5)